MATKIKGAIFDLDGVITQTAEVHFLAWKSTFEKFLYTQNKKEVVFDYQKDYVPYVDGKPRYDGVDSYLKSKGFELPFGSPEDVPGNWSVCSVGNQKNIEYREIIKEKGAGIYESTLVLIDKLEELDIELAVASSSKNCTFILNKTGLIERFKSVVDGNTSEELGLKGKPEPDIFLKAAKNIGLKPEDCIMFEDAVSGVQAGKNGQFGLIIGITRTGEKELLAANGADVVVNDLEEITFEEIEHLFKAKGEAGRGIE